MTWCWVAGPLTDSDPDGSAVGQSAWPAALRENGRQLARAAGRLGSWPSGRSPSLVCAPAPRERGMDPRPVSRMRFWVTTQLCGLAFFLVMGTLGMLVEANDAGCMYVTPAFFMVLSLVYPAARLRVFGAATAVFLLYATLGSFVEYQMQWVVEQQLSSPWGGLAWGLLGVLVGLTTDLMFHFLPARVPRPWRGVAAGAAAGLAFFVTTYVAMTTLYATPASQQSHFVFFSTRAFFSIAWMVLNGAFAGYCATMLAAGSGLRPEQETAAA